jgi:hypothetical protein
MPCAVYHFSQMPCHRTCINPLLPLPLPQPNSCTTQQRAKWPLSGYHEVDHVSPNCRENTRSSRIRPGGFGTQPAMESELANKPCERGSSQAKFGSSAACCRSLLIVMDMEKWMGISVELHGA